MENEMVKRLVWSGILAGFGALASIAANRAATIVWRRIFGMALILVVLGAAAGLIAARAVKRGSPPMPTMAIEEAQKIKETVSAAPEAVPPAGVTPVPTPPSPPVGPA